MQITLLGTGAAGGVPLFGCQCSVCSAAKSDPSLRRRPASALLEVEGAAYLIDAGIMDIGERFEASFLNAIFLTHFHPDHVQGLFHIRWGKEPNISVFCPPDKDGCADLYKHPGLLEFIHQKKYATLK
ncbi:MBL fold metallo-hydrolase, partial [Oleiphilus sp. HI0125]